ncbi:MAG: 5'/3'-nucleotidase SurE [Candidatus Thermoplasmatota archaeon]
MKAILVTNDDGCRSAGFIALILELSRENHQVVGVAPETGRSWIGKAISAHKKLRIKKMRMQGLEVFMTNGTPADCVQLGVYHLLSSRPLLVVSGINIGLNIGTARMLSSGTLGATMEATLLGIPSIAVSLMIPSSVRSSLNLYRKQSCGVFYQASSITSRIVKIIIENQMLGDIGLLSVNIPYGATLESDIEITKPFRAPYGQLFHKQWGGYIHKTPVIQFNDMDDDMDDDFDIKAIRNGKISITPVDLSLVLNEDLIRLRGLLKKHW